MHFSNSQIIIKALFDPKTLNINKFFVYLLVIITLIYKAKFT